MSLCPIRQVKLGKTPTRTGSLVFGFSEITTVDAVGLLGGNRFKIRFATIGELTVNHVDAWNI
jgi:hypothetical protein